jgi:predicted nucleic acid-binding protein
VILVDTGPLVALFDPQDQEHQRCRALLQTIREPLVTTVPVLTEVFHLLTPTSIGSERLREFILRGALSLWFLDDDALKRTFELMEKYADQPMDLADASLVVAAETLKTRKIFSIDRGDFNVYRVKQGHRYYPFEILGT